jgi:hypothetical protein
MQSKTMVVAVSIAAAALAGCASSEEKPVGVGSGTNEMKKSPCAKGGDKDTAALGAIWLAGGASPCEPLPLLELRFRAI